MKKLILASFLLLSACGPAVDDRYPILVSADPEAQGAVREAIRFWNEGAGEEIFAEGFGDVKVAVVDYFPNGDHAHAELSENGSCKVRVVNISANDWSLLAHEFGHCEGFSHSSDPHSIMYPLTDNSQKITDNISGVFYAAE